MSKYFTLRIFVRLLLKNFFLLAAVATWIVAAETPLSTDGDSIAFLNFSSPAPYIFSSLNGLLQQWPNTFFPNGHTIAACEVPKQTLLYHGRLDAEEPPSPEWLAFDMEMSYAIMGSMRTSRLLTYRTTRAVKCLYFDGTSASLMGSGTESQMTFLYGDSDKVPSRPFPGPPGRGRRPRRPPPDGEDNPTRPPPPPPTANMEREADGEPPRWNPLEDEYFRARGLCNWIKEHGFGGTGWGYEGIVRMNAGFEMIWCDFNSTSLKLVSNLNVSAPLLNISDDQSPFLYGQSHSQTALSQRWNEPDVLDEGPHGPGMTDRHEPFRGIAKYMWFSASAKRYGSNGNVDVGGGETRVRIDTCGLFSFYDPSLSDQSSARIQQEREGLNLTAEGRWTGPKSSSDARELALEQLMRRRHSHRANHITEEDGLRMYELVESGLQNVLNATHCSDVPWDTVAREITAFYTRNLQNLQRFVLLGADESEPSHDDDVRLWLQQVRYLTHWFMTPFFEYPPDPYTPGSLHENFSIDSPAAKEGIRRCFTQYVVDGLATRENAGEALLSWAVNETLKGICSTTFSIGLAVEREWLLNFNTESESSRQRNAQKRGMARHAQAWLHELEELMAWLGWVDQWTGCEKGCAANEVCYIPMWPVGEFGFGRGKPEKYLWQPTCVNMTDYPPSP